MSEVIVGVDESEGAADALRWAVREGGLHEWDVTAVMAWSFLDQHRGTVGAPFDPDYDEGDARNALDEVVLAAVGTDAASDVGRRVVCDLPARALLDAATGAGLIVVGARGLGGFRGLLLGSVSQQVLHHATAPVAVVRKPPDPVTGDGAAPERVVVGVDGSEPAQRALRWALDEARARPATLQVVNAWQLPAAGYPQVMTTFDPAVFSLAARRVLDEAVAAEDTTELPVPVELVPAEGPAASVILDAAEGADLVVMGSRGLGGFKRMLLGSVTGQVAQHAPCPVVVVPPLP